MNSDARRWMIAVFALACVSCGGEDSPSEPVDGGMSTPPVVSFDFLPGSWTVESTFITDTGPEQSTAVATFESSIGGRVIKERWIGTRAGAVVESRAMYGRSEHAGLWLIGRADGGAGTFDVLEGGWATSRGSFTSRPDTRPDAGRERITIDSVTSQSFRWHAERSTDAGATWTTYWTMRYTRVAGTPSAATPPDPTPACTGTEYHQFDFWLGGWSVGGARSDIKRLLGGCLIEENWFGSETGTSFNMYDPRSMRWTQVWIDTNDYTSFLQGGITNGDMLLQDPRVGPNLRITWTPLPDTRVRQLGESSSNGGTTWNTIYDLTYIRR